VMVVHQQSFTSLELIELGDAWGNTSPSSNVTPSHPKPPQL
jgi:hypothetical protein